MISVWWCCCWWWYFPSHTFGFFGFFSWGRVGVCLKTATFCKHMHQRIKRGLGLRKLWLLYAIFAFQLIQDFFPIGMSGRDWAMQMWTTWVLRVPKIFHTEQICTDHPKAWTNEWMNERPTNVCARKIRVAKG